MATELILNLLDKKGLEDKKIQCRVDIESYSSIMDEVTPARITLQSYSSTTAILFTLISETVSLGAAKVTFNALVGDQKRSEKWIKFKEPTGKDIRLKVYIVLAEPEEPVNISIAKRHQDIGDMPNCPAVTNLFREKTSELEDLWKNRSGFGDFLTEKSVKISFEPSSHIKEIPIKISTIDNIKPEVLEKSCGECIKAIKDLAFDVNHLKSSCQDLFPLRKQFSNKIEERLQQESLSQQFFYDVKEEKERHAAEIERLLNEERELAKEIQAEDEYQRKILCEIDEMNIEYEYISRENIIIQAEKLKNNDLDSVIQRLQEDYKNCTQKLEDSERKYDAIRKQMENAKDLMQKSLDKFNKELENTKLLYESSAKTNEDLSSKNKALKQIHETLQANAKDLECLKSSLLENKASKALFHLKKEQLLKEINTFHSHFLSENVQIKENLQSTLSSQEKILNSLPSSINKLEESYEDLLLNENKLSSLVKTQTALEQECCIRADLNQLLEDYSSLDKIYRSSRAGILKTLDSGCDYILKESEKVLDECKKIDSMIDSIDDKEYEIENMRTVLGEIKNRQPQYVPFKDDPIDIALSEYLNSCDLPVSIPFKREGEGYYVFGTKKVFLKLENGNVKIRVGGGYTQIDEFIEIYAPIELERQEEAIEVNCPKLSSTFTRFLNGAKGMSPFRAARIIQTAVEAVNQGSPAKATIRSKSKK